jgi:hypothetical protein
VVVAVSSGTRDCGEVSSFLDKLIMVLELLKTFVSLEPELWDLDARELYAGLISKLARARFGEPDVEEVHDLPERVAYKVGYRCTDEWGEGLLRLEVLRPTDEDAPWGTDFKVSVVHNPRRRGGGGG